MIYLTSSNGYWIRDFDCERVINMVITEKAVFPMGKLSSQRAICCSFLMPTAWASCSCRSCHFESVWTAVLLQCALLRTVITVMLMVRVPDVRMAPSSITATVKVRWIFWKYKYSLDSWHKTGATSYYTIGFPQSVFLNVLLYNKDNAKASH